MKICKTIKLQDERVFFTSDYHLWHTNIIKYANRPFEDIQTMNEAILERHNNLVSDDDIVFNLGDACLSKGTSSKEDKVKFLKQFKGKIHYLPGNHENDIELVYLAGWKVLPQLQEISIVDQRIVLCHYAMRVWNRSHHGSYHLFGHSHGSLVDDFGVDFQKQERFRAMDVGVDNNDFAPYSFAEIKDIMGKKKFTPIDHHTPER